MDCTHQEQIVITGAMLALKEILHRYQARTETGD